VLGVILRRLILEETELDELTLPLVLQPDRPKPKPVNKIKSGSRSCIQRSPQSSKQKVLIKVQKVHKFLSVNRRLNLMKFIK
jgi:hypothetical protein